LSLRSTTALAACLLVAACVVFAIVNHGAGVPPIALAATIDAKWGGQTPTASDARQAMSPGAYQLDSGRAMLAFEGGARVVVEAPAKFSVAKASLTLSSGQIAVLCADAKSRELVIHTSTTEIVDLGTEFGVAVTTDGATDVRVFDGRIRVTPKGATAKELTSGESIQVNAAAQFAAATASTRFVRVSEFEVEQRSRISIPSSRWTASTLARVRKDTDLLLWCDMNAASDTSAVPNLASYDAVPIRRADGSIRPLRFVDGRQAGDKAVEFIDATDRLVVNVPGRFDRMTLAVWVQLYGEDADALRHRGLLMSNGFGDPGQAHWQGKGRDFRLSFFSGGEGTFARFAARPDALMDGGWHLLVTVVDTSVPTVTHYLDGVRVYQRKIDGKAPALTLGPSSIGGKAPDAAKPDDHRALNGKIDDLLVWRRALSADEVKQLYVEGGGQGQ
jgi:hypothetical protein